MDKDTYLRFLKALLLNRVPVADAEDIVRFYTEYFEDAGKEKEAEVMTALGSPEELTAKIMEQRAYEEAEGLRPRSNATEYASSPISVLPRWARLSILVLAWIWLVPVVGGLFLAFGIGGLALIVCGACAVAIGIFSSGIGSKLLTLGIALVFVVLGALLLQGAGGFCKILKSSAEKSRRLREEGSAL